MRFSHSQLYFLSDSGCLVHLDLSPLSLCQGYDVPKKKYFLDAEDFTVVNQRVYVLKERGELIKMHKVSMAVLRRRQLDCGVKNSSYTVVSSVDNGYLLVSYFDRFLKTNGVFLMSPSLRILSTLWLVSQRTRT